MNGKLAKKLRQQARVKTHGNPEVSYNELGVSPRYYIMNTSPVKVAKGVPRTLDSSSTRGYYQRMKKALKA